jgi:hypothetical protein
VARRPEPHASTDARTAYETRSSIGR